jgi:hypothetical protein
MTMYVDARGESVNRCDQCGERMPLWGCDRRGNSICYDCEARMADDQRGMDWWNGQDEDARAHWLSMAQTSVPAEAWRYYNRSERQARVVSGTGASGERRELAALVRGLRARD